MKLAIGFITYNESSSSYLPNFLKSLKEALNFASLDDYLVYGFENSDLDFRNNSDLIKEFLSLNPDFNYQQLTSNGKNLGFAKPYNSMIETAISSGFDYFLVINPDVVFSRESIRLLIEPLLLDNNLSATAPRIMSFSSGKLEGHNLIDSFGIGLKRGLKFFDIAQGEEYQKEKKEEYLSQGKDILAPSGAAGFYRLRSLSEAGEVRSGKKEYFDERFFMYKEDCDLAYRLHSFGLKSLFVFDAIIYHDRTTKSLGPGLFSFFRARSKKGRLARLWSFRNQHFIFIKHFSTQNFLSKTVVIVKILTMLVFALIFEQFLLKEYKNIYLFWKNKLTID